MIYLTAIGLTPGGSSTAHIYTQTIHNTQNTYAKVKILGADYYWAFLIKKYRTTYVQMIFACPSVTNTSGLAIIRYKCSLKQKVFEQVESFIKIGVLISIIYCLFYCDPTAQLGPKPPHFEGSGSHTIRHTTPDRNPLGE
jgi:hypothetical protein